MRTKRTFRQKLVRFLKWGFGTVLALVILGIGTLRFHFWRVAGELHEKREQASRLGIPLTDQDLRTAETADSEDAAPIYDRAITAFDLEKNDGTFQSAITEAFEPNRPGSSLTSSDIELAWKRAEPIMSIVREVVARPNATLFPPPTVPEFYDYKRFGYLKNFVKLLCFDADKMSHLGKDREAQADLMAAARICTHVDQQEGVISLLVAEACRMMVHRGAERALSHSKRAYEWAIPLRRLANELAQKCTYLDALKGEAYYAIQSCRSFEKLAVSYERENEFMPDPQREIEISVGNAFRFLVGGSDFDQAQEVRVLEYWIETFKAAKELSSDSKEFHARQVLLERKYEKSNDPADFMARLSSWVVFDGSEFILQARARVAVMLQAADLLESGKRNGRFPASSLEVSGWRSDPFTKLPLLYKPKAGGFVLYSVGKDLLDDDGRSFRKEDGSGGVDVCFEYPWTPPPKRA